LALAHSSREPQDEIAVWLHGAGAARDVTQLHSIACASPFTVCISFGNMEATKKECGGNKMSLELRERDGAQRLLGKIGLRFSTAIQMGQMSLGLFHARSCAGYCLPKARFWAHYLQQAYWRWRDKKVPNVRMSLVQYPENGVLGNLATLPPHVRKTGHLGHLTRRIQLSEMATYRPNELLPD
jgi:hypothetical protein